MGFSQHLTFLGGSDGDCLEGCDAGAGIDEEDQLLSEGSDLAPQHHLDGTPMELPAAQQLDAQLATEDVETASDASEASEDSIQAEAVQPLAADAATEGAEDKGHGPVGGSGAAVQEAHLNEAPLYPGDPHVQVMLYAACKWNALKCLVLICES